MAKQADASGEVVMGIMSVHSIHAYVLFNSGATNCFISSRFIGIVYPVTL